MPEGLVLTSIPVREDHRDAYIANDHVKLKDLPAGAIVGTSSLRRGAQITAARPDVEIKWIRGNIETRLRKLREEDFDAIVLAVSGMKRVSMDESIITEYLGPDVCVPAAGQGALAIECREDDKEMRAILDKISDEHTTQTVTAERTFNRLLEGGCQVPIGGYAYLENDDIILTAFVGTPDGKTVLKETARGNAGDPEKVGEQAANAIIDRGGKQIIDRVKEELDS